MKYLVNVEEILSRNVIIEAENETDAESKVEDLYRKEKIVLDYHDFIGEPTIKCQRVCVETEECTEFEE
ncbi:MAG: DpnD/PcfM family protein [Bacteroidales bacterium]|nr:DpnD/PcfM family protein [Bacteroidales bacterium]